MAGTPFETRSPYEQLQVEQHTRLVVDICRGMFYFLIPVILLYGVILIRQPSEQVLATLVGVSLIIPLVRLASNMARRGAPLRATYILIPSIMVILAFNSLMISGLVLVVGPVYIALVVISGMLLDPTMAYLSAGVASVLWTAVYIVEAQGWVQQAILPGPFGTISMVLIEVLTFLFVAILAQFATANLRRQLDDATYDLVQANRDLEQANKLKSQFTARTSHELRTPLSAIIVFTDLALRGVYGPLTDKLHDSLNRVLLSAKRLRDLIEDILDISKIEAGELEIVEEPFRLQNLADLLHAELHEKAREKDLDFDVMLSPELPVDVVGDEKRLSQVVINLTHNAVKFTDTGSVQVRMAPVDAGRWQIVVQDTGRGIHEGHFKTIFDEFRQANRHDQESGTGLGLAITRSLVEMMGGSISLASDLSTGSTFTVTLPLKPAPQIEAMPIV